MEKIEELFSEWIKGAEYERIYPQINLRNVFSISTLAWDVQKQVDWKLNKKRDPMPDYISQRMFAGKASHEYLQKRMAELNEGWHFEREVSIRLPYQWSNYPELKNIILLGHIDAIRYEPYEIFELKSSAFPGQIGAYPVLQAGTYAFILGYLARYPFIPEPPDFPRTVIVKVNDTVHIRELTPLEIMTSWSEMTTRAYDAARKVDIK